MAPSITYKSGTQQSGIGILYPPQLNLSQLWKYCLQECNVEGNSAQDQQTFAVLTGWLPQLPAKSTKQHSKTYCIRIKISIDLYRSTFQDQKYTLQHNVWLDLL